MYLFIKERKIICADNDNHINYLSPLTINNLLALPLFYAPAATHPMAKPARLAFQKPAIVSIKDQLGQAAGH